MRRREWLTAYLFVAPAMLLITLFVLWPTVNTFRTSLHATALTQQGQGEFCGADNYRVVLTDPKFQQSARNTAVFTVLVVPVQVVLALALALWANQQGAASRWLRFTVLLPTVLSLTVLSVLWKLLCEPASAAGSGLFNGLLASVHLPPQPFLTSPHQAMLAIAVMSVWQGVGFQMMILLCALQQIPPHLYEASLLDGAGRWRRFWHVTLPRSPQPVRSSG